jgi:hypothetical protein
MTLADYATTSGIAMELPGDIWVNAPVGEHNPNFVRESRHVLDWMGDRFFVRSGGQDYPAKPLPVPAYSDHLNSAGEPHKCYGITHTDRVRISPIEGCANACSFCDLPRTYKYTKKRADLLIEAVDAALADPEVPARHVLISGGTPVPDDYGYLADVYGEVLHAFPETPIDIMMLPIPKVLDLAELRRQGTNELSINLELFGDKARAKYTTEKGRIGKAEFLQFLERAVEMFEGRVRSLLLVGLEPIGDTLDGVRALAERGCEPVLSPFRPSPATPLAGLAPPSVDFLSEVYEKACEVGDHCGMKLGPKCIPCQHNTLTFPDGTDYYFCY